MYLGIDQALGHTGVAVIDAKAKLIELAVVKTGDSRGAHRLAQIWDGVDAIASRYAVKQACIEGYAYDATGRTFDLGEVGGIIRLLLYRKKIPFKVVAPAQLKKFAGVGPQADKPKVMKAVAKKWGIEIDQDDACDAYVLSRVAHLLAGGTSQVRDELEVLAALRAVPQKVIREATNRKQITI
jgi:Holliday junction resolvasome RuvABC endonuclease subunit